jgi:hypothetical protein
MTELTTAARPGRKRLVLGFDAGCATCRAFSKKIAEKVGDRLEVRSLNDPEVRRWREGSLGPDAPWLPTLIEVGHGTVRAWTGGRLGVRLGLALGPMMTWRVLQALGEVRGGTSTGEHTTVGRAMSRGRFVGGVGGALVAMSALSGAGRLASPAKAAASSLSVSYTELTADSLFRLARTLVERRDVMNVMDAEWRDKVRSGRVVVAETGGETLEGLGTGKVSVRNGQFKFSGAVVPIKAARHRMADGNRAVVISYAIPDLGQLVVYSEYEKPTFLPGDQTKTKAQALLYELAEDQLTLQKASSNGQLQTLGTSEGSYSTLSHCAHDRRCSSPCDRAWGYSSCHRIKSIGCVAYQCRACALSCAGGALLCAACALVICTVGVIRECCTGGYGCKVCGWCH